MGKDVLRTAVFLNGLGEETRVDQGLIDAAFHPLSTNVVPYELQGDNYDTERLTGLVNTLEEQAAYVRRQPSITLVTVGSHSASVALETAQIKDVMGVAALGPDLKTHDLPKLEKLRGDGLEVVVFQPIFGDSLRGEDKALRDLLGEDMHILRRSTTMQRPPVAPDVMATLGHFSRRTPARRGKPLPVA